MAGETHTHPGDGRMWQVIDIAVWCSVALIAIIALEWLTGRVVRERIASQAGRFLATAGASPAGGGEAGA